MSQPLQVLDPPLEPHDDGLWRQPTDADEYIDGADIALLGQRRLRRRRDPRLEAPPSLTHFVALAWRPRVAAR